jgi:hypothetical protein
MIIERNDECGNAKDNDSNEIRSRDSQKWETIRTTESPTFRLQNPSEIGHV